MDFVELARLRIISFGRKLYEIEIYRSIELGEGERENVRTTIELTMLYNCWLETKNGESSFAARIKLLSCFLSSYLAPFLFLSFLFSLLYSMRSSRCKLELLAHFRSCSASNTIDHWASWLAIWCRQLTVPGGSCAPI